MGHHNMFRTSSLEGLQQKFVTTLESQPFLKIPTLKKKMHTSMELNHCRHNIGLSTWISKNNDLQNRQCAIKVMAPLDLSSSIQDPPEPGVQHGTRLAQDRPTMLAEVWTSARRSVGIWNHCWRDVGPLQSLSGDTFWWFIMVYSVCSVEV